MCIDSIDMNIHHLELFYYVARFEGISAACRQIPYGVQQPAVSAQLAALEKSLGVTLFARRPFVLTDAGRALYDFVRPFFSGLADMESLLRGQLGSRLRLAGLTEVMRGHVPALLGELRVRFPGLSVTLHEIDQRGAEKLIADGGADLAITVLESRLPPGFRSIRLAELRPCLLVPSAFPERSVKALFAAGASGKLPLVSLPDHELLPRLFHRELTRRGLVWKTAMEASSQDLVAIYVRHQLGVGLGVAVPEMHSESAFRVVALRGFPTLPIGVFWRGNLGEVATAMRDGLVARSKIYQTER
jgi:DNA-binding transcriptional LysR family regulator